MWSYYGSKSKVVHLYPPPLHSKIIEPFAGTAKYSLRYFDRDVLLVDKDPIIVRLWHFLQGCTPADILGLPNLSYKQSVDDYDISEDEKLLMGFMVARGVASPQKIVQKFSNISHSKKRIAGNLFKIKHWVIREGDYREITNEYATWFIDPPYQYGGEHYRYSNKSIDYEELADWCQSREGQVIVCENTRAQWLPFRAMKAFRGAYSVSTEAIWSNYPTVFDAEQLKFPI